MSKSNNRHFAPGDRVDVLLPLPLDDSYEYSVGAGLDLVEGDIVEVPFGGRSAVGVVWGAGGADVSEDRLRPVRARCDVPPLPSTIRRFVDWVAAYTVSPRGAVLRMAMSVPAALRPSPSRTVWTLASSQPNVRWTPERQRVAAVAADGAVRSAAELAAAAGVGSAVVAGLARAGVLVPAAAADTAASGPDWRRPGPILSPAQMACARRLRDSVHGGFSVTLLDGVAGSGKTEVYFEAVAETLALGRQALVLVPEIALTAQWLERFRRRFGAPPALWHSDLGEAARRRTWRGVAEGVVDVVVGARSALFLPFPRLGLVIVDEEHDQGFKQDDGVAYHARDLAVVRARASGVPAVLVSATPSLETIVNVRSGRYAVLALERRHFEGEPPAIAVADLRRDRPPPGAWLSATLRRALAETRDGAAQSLLFLNRRGYAPLTLCRACGFRWRCPNCSAWLVEHRFIGLLRCHHCGHATPTPATCPSCAGQGSLVGCGPGVERVAEEVAALLPGARVAIATSDTVSGPGAAAALIGRIVEREVDVVIATQMLAKGHHFPHLTLVGVVDADLGLSGGDLRAAERTFQMLAQVAGRSGRAERPGRVVVQTHMPEHPVIAALIAGDRDAFIAAECEARREAGMPPFSRLAALVVSAADESAVERAARDLAVAAGTAGIEVFGPAVPPLALLRGRHRRRLLLRAARSEPLSALIRPWIIAARWPRGVRVQVDIDPYTFL